MIISITKLEHRKVKLKQLESDLQRLLEGYGFTYDGHGHDLTTDEMELFFYLK